MMFCWLIWSVLGSYCSAECWRFVLVVLQGALLQRPASGGFYGGVYFSLTVNLTALCEVLPTLPRDDLRDLRPADFESPSKLLLRHPTFLSLRPHG